jgi:hypothetical protein
MLRPMFATAFLASSLLAGQVQAQIASKPLTNASTPDPANQRAARCR